MKFEDILSNENLLDAVYDMRYETCTPIQEKSIPYALKGADILAVAQTGTGKTAAYLLPVIEQLIEDNYPQDRVNCVIMAPTRELAQQIDQQLQGLSYYLPITSMPIYGGTDGQTYTQQRISLKTGADIIIATPGRLLSHINLGHVDLSKVSFFILDEADRMLDMGFLEDILKIISQLPKDRQTMMFSATLPDNIKTLASKILRDPVEIQIEVSKPAEKIKQEAYLCYEENKLTLLKKLFKLRKPEKAIVFASSKQKVKDLFQSLSKKPYKVAEMHSDLNQKERDNVMLDFKAGKINVIIATDIISRGIDIDNIETIINYDVPHEAEEYVHRIGRTARADKEGEGVTFISEKEIGKFNSVEKKLGIEVFKAPLPEGIPAGPEYILNKKKKKKYYRPKGLKTSDSPSNQQRTKNSPNRRKTK